MKLGWWVALVALVALGQAACMQMRTRVTATGPWHPPKPPGCSFQMMTALPAANYTEIGVIDVTDNATRIIGRFQHQIAVDVCKLGGDAALAQANGFGYYIKATVLKYVAPPPPVGAMPPPPAHAAATPLAPPPPPIENTAGCHYDTQCKGDRICVEGRCTEPAPAPP
jgi:hypothetical protein